MSGLGDSIGAMMGEFLGHPIVGLVLSAGGAYLAIVWLAAAYWAFQDTARRSDDLVRPYVTAAAVLLATPFAFPAALLIHLVTRPPLTRAQRRTSDLELRLLQAEADRATCPGCQRPTRPGWCLCPACGMRIGRSCASCGGAMELGWDICAHCATELAAPVVVSDWPGAEPLPPADDPVPALPAERPAAIAASSSAGPGATGTGAARRSKPARRPAQSTNLAPDATAPA